MKSLIQKMCDDIIPVRHELHQNPATSYEEFYASDLIARKLTEWGIGFERNWAETGIVATIEGRHPSDRAIGLRADIDALDIIEESGQPWSSKISGKMHACGHDGHTSILLGTAKYLQETKNFSGRVHLIFQPAEEGDGGAFRMIEQGLFDRFPMEAVFGLHNWPNLELGKIEFRAGPMWASTDRVTITIRGDGGHAASPHQTIDPIVIGSEIVMALQTIVSRNVDPIDAAVVSVTNFNAGTGAENIIPSQAEILVSVRALKPAVRDVLEQRITEIVTIIATSHRAKADVSYRRLYDPLVNDPEMAEFCAQIARSVVGPNNVNDKCLPWMGAEDFGAFLARKKGCYILLGQKMPDQNSPHNYMLHHPKYDFNDQALPIGIEYFSTLVEKYLEVA
jgi:hippurate hydrolase